MNFPEYLSDEDMDLFLKELRLSGVSYDRWSGAIGGCQEVWFSNGDDDTYFAWGYSRRSRGGWVFLQDCLHALAKAAQKEADAYRVKDDEFPQIFVR